MRWYEISEGVGRIVKGVNTTPDVGVDQTSIEAKKFGNSVDKDGKPLYTMHKKAHKNTKPNTLFNMGMTESQIKELKSKELSAVSEIYVDMDGVLADFFPAWKKIVGKDWRQITDIESALQTIRDKEDFWLSLPLTNNAQNLLNIIKDLKGEYKILSAPLANDPKAEPHKREWVKKNLAFFPPKEVIISADKYKWAKQADGTPNILIDDFGSNIRNWEAKGGVGFKHKDHKFERTAGLLKDYFNKPVEERELSKDEDKEKERIVKGMKKNKSDFKKRYGDNADAVMYATATKMAKSG